MAKRAPITDKPFTALDKGLAASVMNPIAIPATEDVTPTVAAPVSNADATVIEPHVMTPVAAVASAEPQVRSKPPAKTAPIAHEKLAREKRVLLSVSEEREIERCVDRIAESFGSPVKLSHLIRACLTVVRHAEKEITAKAKEAGNLQRPANGDLLALVEYEHAVARVLSHAFRDAPSIR